MQKKVHTFCISKNDDGVMLCSGCGVLHAYTDAIQCLHPMDPIWKSKLITYYQNKNGIPKGVSFLAGEEYLQSQEILKNMNKRKTNNSSDRSSEKNKSNRKKANNGTRRLTRRRVSS